MTSGPRQRIVVDSLTINSNMTPVYVLNKLYKAGWVYVGDALHMPLPLKNDWHMLTLKRKENEAEVDTRGAGYGPEKSFH